MDLSEFSQGLETFGADLQKWPPAEAEQALALLETSAEALALFVGATADDLALFGPDDAPDLGARVMAKLRNSPSE
jgi:hypothetical protein